MIGIYNGPWSRDNQLACCTIVPTFVARDPKRSAMWKGRKRRDRGTRSILTTCALLIPSAFQTGCDIGRLAFPKYQPANHVTSHTRSILDAILCRVVIYKFLCLLWTIVSWAIDRYIVLVRTQREIYDFIHQARWNPSRAIDPVSRIEQRTIINRDYSRVGAKWIGQVKLCIREWINKDTL